jgi:predicted RNA methylase
MSFVKKIYKVLIPESFRLRLYEQKIARIEKIKRQNVLSFYRENPSEDSEINEALQFLNSHPISPLPYSFYTNYLKKDITVYTDSSNRLPYVNHNGNKLYFKKSWNYEDVKKSYRILLAEQDLASPHRYLTDQYQIEKNSVVIDVGAAEGIFALDEMHNISHLYLIETDPEWIEALKVTYAKWSDKITIIPKYVSNIDDDKNVRLDTYFSSHNHIDFLKIDVDGAEQELLYGATEVISRKTKRVAICTYHKANDNVSFTAHFKEAGYRTHNSSKYLLFYHDSNFLPPYFRRALLRAEK